MHAGYPSQPPRRGTLILDANFIINLSCPVPEEQRDPHAKPPIMTFLGLLPFLARNGYEILIPEVVSFEAAQILADGKSTRNIRSLAGRHAHQVYSRAFLKAVALGEYPNIEIVSNTGPAEADDFCRMLDDALTRTPEKSRWGQRDAYAAKRKAIRDVDENTNREQLGDKAVLSLSNRLLQQKHTSDLFVLTDDNGLTKQLPVGARRVKLRAFLHHVADAGIAPYTGLDSNVNADIVARHLYDTNGMDPTRSDHLFSQEYSENYLAQLKEKPSRLLMTLKALKITLDQSPPEPQEESPRPSHVQNAAARRATALSNFRLTGK